MGCKISGSAKALPAHVVTNDDLAKIVDTSDEWIVERTGIHERRIALEESCTDLGTEACEGALAMAKVAPEDIDLLICMTISGDVIVPSQAALLKARLGLQNAIAFDLNAACAGCIYGIEVAASLIEASVASDAAGAGRVRRNPLRRALVVGAERLSRVTDWEDRSTCVLFGDGAGAVVLEWDEAAPGILSSFLKNTDDETLCLTMDADYAMDAFPFGDGCASQSASEIMDIPLQDAEGELLGFAQPTRTIRMNGQRVFKFATSAIVEAARAACDRANVSLDEVACIIPHQANDRIIRYAAKKLKVPYERWQVSIGQVGNTSASSVLMALADAYEAGRINPGDKVLLVGFGGGLTSGALLFEV